jgi:Putative addiction module component
MGALELKEEVSRLSKTEQLQALEWLWASLSQKREPIGSPEWHGEVLATRKAKVASGKAEFLTVAQLKKRLRR